MLHGQDHSLKGEKHISGITFIVCRHGSGMDYISGYFSPDNVVNNVNDFLCCNYSTKKEKSSCTVLVLGRHSLRLDSQSWIGIAFLLLFMNSFFKLHCFFFACVYGMHVSMCAALHVCGYRNSYAHVEARG